MERERWLAAVRAWRNWEPLAVEQLADLVVQLPERALDNLTQASACEALAYWLEACLILTQQCHANGQLTRGFSYLQLAYGRLQSLVCRCDIPLEMRRWLVKKLDSLMVVVLEFCQCQPEPHWQQQSEVLLELHIRFMQQHNPLVLQLQLPETDVRRFNC